MLAGTLVLLPLILAYTGYVYWLFRGKVGPGEKAITEAYACSETAAAGAAAALVPAQVQ